jgi:hypothetical protein
MGQGSCHIQRKAGRGRRVEEGVSCFWEALMAPEGCCDDNKSHAEPATIYGAFPHFILSRDIVTLILQVEK